MILLSGAMGSIVVSLGHTEFNRFINIRSDGLVCAGVQFRVLFYFPDDCSKRWRISEFF